MSLTIDTRAAMRRLTKDLRGLAREQIPFAIAQTLTATARDIASAETAQLTETFAKATPFTRRALGVVGARKSSLTARVFVRGRQAMYLDPYAHGGKQVLFGKRAILTPVDVGLNAYQNLPRGKLKALKGRGDVFIGPLKRKDGAVLNGVWQRARQAKTGRRHRGQVKAGQLKLLILFTDPKTVTKTLPYEALATKIVNRRLGPNFEVALAKALASAK